ncbi:putative GDP-mannose pyrophosphorylase [Erythrobacter sp. SD-21]|nr:putative GDP-mannose pyrophosphorylase [Erythrobacter sp. SD-21]
MGDATPFEQTLARVSDRSRFAPSIVVAGKDHCELVERQGGHHSLIVEPVGRNTAPAIALAALTLPPETVMLVCPSDHHIANESAFRAGVERAAKLARKGWLVCLAVEPERPETGYGYIERGAREEAGHLIARFVEKPDCATAQSYVASGKFVWNTGIFVFRAADFLAELALQRPQMMDLIERAHQNGLADGTTFLAACQPFAQINPESVDYAVMEHTKRGAMVSADMGWSDIGNWDALMTLAEGDTHGNVVEGRADLVDCSGVLVRSEGLRVSALGLKDVVIVVSHGELLVTTREHSQNIGELPGAQER